MVLKGSRVSFYKDQKSYRTAPDVTYRGEQTIDVTGGKAEVASDYTKKKHVFRLRSVGYELWFFSPNKIVFTLVK